MSGLRRYCRLQTEILVQSRRQASFRPKIEKILIMIFGVEILVWGINPGIKLNYSFV